MTLSDGEPLLLYPMVGDPALLHSVSISQCQKGQITRKNNDVITCNSIDSTIVLVEVSLWDMNPQFSNVISHIILSTYSVTFPKLNDL